MKINEALYNLENPNSFYEASFKVKQYKESHPNNHVVSLGIGDVSFPISKHVASKMKEAIEKETSDDFVGYGNYYGIPELRKAIRDNEYKDFSIDEIYVGNGTKTDVGDLLELFSKDALIGIVDPTYPIYLNTVNSLSRQFDFIECDGNLLPIIPTNKHFDVIYLCSPNNPTGVNFSKDYLSKWIAYAKKENAVIIYDNVYFKFVSNGVSSIYEVEGSREVAIECRSFSKHASFTGLRCSYYVIPNELGKDVNKFWRLRTINRFNGASYISQIGALASFDKEAKGEVEEHIKYYKENASILVKAFNKLGYQVIGGEDAPYLFVKCKNNLSSWEVFELFLNKLEVIVVPGIIFGSKGDNYFRVSALGKREDIKEAIRRLEEYEKNM